MSRIGPPPVSPEKRRYSPISRSTLFGVRASSMSGPDPRSGCRDSDAPPPRPALRSASTPAARPFARAADLHVEGLQIGEVRMVRLHRGDHGIHRPALERMHGRGPCPVDMAKLRISGGHIQHPPVSETERHLAASDRRDLGRLAVDEPEAGIVAGPAEAVAGAELDVLTPVDLDPGRARTAAETPALAEADAWVGWMGRVRSGTGRGGKQPV